MVGAGIVSGSPYGCNELHDPENTCSGWEKHAHKENTSIPWKEYIGDLEDFIHQQYKDGLIDDPKHLAKKKVFLFIGSKDDQVSFVQYTTMSIALWLLSACMSATMHVPPTLRNTRN